MARGGSSGEACRRGARGRWQPSSPATIRRAVARVPGGSGGVARG
jgi:hypothetical protein